MALYSNPAYCRQVIVIEIIKRTILYKKPGKAFLITLTGQDT